MPYICRVTPYTSYLTKNDYLPTIQEGQMYDQILDKAIQGNVQRIFSESWAMSKVREHLSSQFDVDFELKDTLPYNPLKDYFAGERCTIDFPAWDKDKTDYKQDNLVIYNGVGYSALIDSPDSTTFNDSQWIAIGNQYDIYHIKFPYPIFSLDIQQSNGITRAGYYKVGDIVWWNNHTYECLIATSLMTHDTQQQYGTYGDLGYPNVFPTDLDKGTQYWKDLGVYTIPAGTLPEYPSQQNPNPTWTLGDNRDVSVVQTIVFLSTWMLHFRISPNNIPAKRTEGKDLSFAWLRSVKKAEVTTSLLQIQPEQGTNISWGADIKKQNGYT